MAANKKHTSSTIALKKQEANRAALRPVAPDITNGFVCSIRFNNDLPSVPFDPKFVKYPFPNDRFHKFQPTSLDRLQKPVLHVEKDVGVPINLFEALRNIQSAASGMTVANEDDEDKSIPMPINWGNEDDWKGLTEEQQQLEGMHKDDRELWNLAKKKVNVGTSTNKNGNKRIGAIGYFSRKTALRSKRGKRTFSFLSSFFIYPIIDINTISCCVHLFNTHQYFLFFIFYF